MAIKRALQNYRHYFLRQLDTGSRVMVAVILVLLTGFLWFVLASENP